MKRFRSIARGSAFVPTTSMADIAFLLIIFFMVSAEFSIRKGLIFSVPDAGSAEPSPVDATPLVLSLDAGGRLSIDGAPADLTDINRALAPRLEASPNQWVLVRADGDTPYSRVVEVLDQLKQLGAKNIAVPTRAELVELRRPSSPLATPGAPP